MASGEPKAASKAVVDPNFEKQVKRLIELAKTRYENGKLGQTQWERPEVDSGEPSWDGNLDKIDEVGAVFNREAANTSFVDAIKDAESPGADGDLVAAQLQVDYLGCADRAFQARHTFNWPRAYALALGRKRGQGDDRGPLGITVLELVRHIVGEAKV